MSLFHFLAEKLFLSVPQKHALVIAVSDYRSPYIPELSADVDAKHLKKTLEYVGFKKSNIRHLGYQAATKDNIIASWKELNAKIKPGDIVYISYSGHGSQILDDAENFDEVDRKDEVWVPYDAVYDTKTRSLQPDTVVVDDTIDLLLKETRKKLGEEGHVLMTTDSCHNASVSRSLFNRSTDNYIDPNAVLSLPELPTDFREVPEGFVTDEEGQSSGRNMASFTSISASRDSEVAKEIVVGKENMGALTYALISTLGKAQQDTTYLDLMDEIRHVFTEHNLVQKPQIRGAKNLAIFSNKLMLQEPYTTISSFYEQSQARIEMGSILGVNQGSTVALYPQGTKRAVGTALAKGTVRSSSPEHSIVTLSQGLESIDWENPQKYRVFITQRSFFPNGTSLYIGDLSTELQEQFRTELLPALPFVKILDTMTKSRFVLRYHNGEWKIKTPEQVQLKEETPSIDFGRIIPNFQRLVAQQYLMELVRTYRNPQKFIVEPVHLDGSALDNSQRTADGSIVFSQKDRYRFKLTNNSDSLLYVSIIDLVKQKSIKTLIPDKDTYDDQHRLIEAQWPRGITVPPQESVIFPPVSDGPEVCFEMEEDSKGVTYNLFVAQTEPNIDFRVLDSEEEVNLIATNRSRNPDPLLSPLVRSRGGGQRSGSVFRGYTAMLTLNVAPKE